MKSLEGMEIYLETIKDASKTMSTFIKSIKEMLPSEYRSSDPEEQQEKVSLFFDQIPTYIQYQERLQEQPKTDPELQEAYRAIEAMPK
jgi:hypothetical protein